MAWGAVTRKTLAYRFILSGLIVVAPLLISAITVAGVPPIPSESKVVTTPVDQATFRTGDSDNISTTSEGNNSIPVADAGASKTVDEKDPVELNGTGSYDPDNDSLTYSWIQTKGPPVSLNNSDTPTPTFTAPVVRSTTEFVFKLSVKDGNGENATDPVSITVEDKYSVSKTLLSNHRFLLPVGEVPDGWKINENGGIVVYNSTGNGSAEMFFDGMGRASISQYLDRDLPKGSKITVRLRTTGLGGGVFDPGGNINVFLGGNKISSITAPEDGSHVIQFTTGRRYSAGTSLRIQTVGSLRGGVSNINSIRWNYAPNITIRYDEILTGGGLGRLNASSTVDLDGDVLSYSWEQTSGPSATIQNHTTPTTTFVAPYVTTPQTLRFEITATDGSLSNTKTVSVDVHPNDDARLAAIETTQSLTPGRTTPNSLGGKLRIESAFAHETSVQLLRDSSTNYSLAVTAPDKAENVTMYVQRRAISAVQNITALEVYLDGEKHPFEIRESAEHGGSPWVAFNIPHFSTRTITFASPTADLTVTNISLAPASPVKKDNVSFSVEIKNQGEGNASGFATELAIGNDTLTVDAINLTEGKSRTITFSSWTAVVGTYNVSATVDHTNAVNETNETNNDKTTTIKVESKNQEPVAEAGASRIVDEGDSVELFGLDSSDPDNDTLSYSWSQLFGPPVSLDDSNTATPTFTAPAVKSTKSLVFELTVRDGESRSSKDTVVVDVRNRSRLTEPLLSNPSFFVNILESDEWRTTEGESSSVTWNLNGNRSVNMFFDAAGSATITQPFERALPEGSRITVRLSTFGLSPGGEVRILLDGEIKDGISSPSDGSHVLQFRTEQRYPNGTELRILSIDGRNGGISNIRSVKWNSKPDGTARSNQKVLEGKSGRLNASGSVDFDADELSYSWVQTSGPSVTFQNTTTATPTFVAPHVTTRRLLGFEVTVSDGDLSHTATTTVAVQPNNDSRLASFEETQPLTATQTTPSSLSGKLRVETGFERVTSVELVRNSSTNYSLDITAPEEAENVTVYLQRQALSASQNIDNIEMYLDGKRHPFEIRKSPSSLGTNRLKLSAGTATGQWLVFNIPSFSTRTITLIGDSNEPPTNLSIRTPANGTDDVGTAPTLRWSASDPDGDSLRYTVRLERGTSPPNKTIVSNLSSTSYNLSELSQDATYNWQIVAKDEHGTTTQGPVWNFTTNRSITLNAQNGLAIHNNSAYLVSTGDIIRVDLATRRVTARFPAPAGRPDGLAYGDGLLWFSDGVESDFKGEILGLDPETGALQSRFSVSYDPTGIAYGDGSLWVGDVTTNRVVEYSLTGTERSSFDVGEPLGTVSPRALAYYNDSLWVGTTDTNCSFNFEFVGPLRPQLDKAGVA
jgi:hypothetical protein